MLTGNLDTQAPAAALAGELQGGAGALAGELDVDTPVLTLADFEQTGREFDVLALIEAGTVTAGGTYDLWGAHRARLRAY